MAIGMILRWAQLMFAVTFLAVESFFRRIVSFFIELLPRAWVTHLQTHAEEPLLDSDAATMIRLQGYPCEEHYVETQDGFILGLQRIPHGRIVKATTKKKSPREQQQQLSPENVHEKEEEPPQEEANEQQQDTTATTLAVTATSTSSTTATIPGTGRPVVFIMHGFMQSSEAWLARSNPGWCLPFILADQGFDVWLGNNRGNKYSYKHRLFTPQDTKFWDWSMDELIAYDIPAIINFALRTSGQTQLSYIGFSQGSAQAFGALASNHALNSQINLFVAMAPATRVRHIRNPLVDSFVRTKPEVIYDMFGRHSIMPSTLFWRQVCSRALWTAVIDRVLLLLFGWNSKQISATEKPLMYSHVYSSASVKTVVHWFQILQSGRFQMYDDGVRPLIPSQYQSRIVPHYSLSQIKVPIAMFYGGADSLPHFESILDEIDPVFVHREDQYEHLCFMWARDAHVRVYPHVVELLRQYNQ